MKEPVYWQTAYARFSRRLSFSRALSLSAAHANRRSLVPSLSLWFSLSLSLEQASRSGKRKGKRKKERRTRIVATRESRVCSQCARRVRSVFTGLVLSCLVSTRLATPSSYLTTPRSTSPHLLHLITHLSIPSTLRPLPHFVSLRLASSSRVPPLLST